jgi:hypothetical protein
MIRGLPLLARLALGPSGLGVQVLSYVHAQQLFVGTFVPSFRHERTPTGGKISTKMQMQDLFNGF